MEALNKSFPALGSRREVGDEFSTSFGTNGRNSLTPSKARDSNFDTSRILLNDDDFEKRNRRKEALDKKKSRRATILPQTNKRHPNGVALADEVPLPVLTTLSLDEINRRYEEWMKIAADNKINTTNTWNFELIDYFSKINFFKDGNSINFQKASCTLDGCVKIYTSRVDSVVSETGILLNGLAESSAKRTKELVEEFDGETEKRKKKSSRSEQTLAKDFSTITLKAFDIEFSVDPLFKKTCADFDEGGARGLLLNHLTTQSDGRLIFDASDAKTPESKENLVLTDAEPETISTRINFNSLLDSLFEDDGLINKTICPSLGDFQFGSNFVLELPDLADLQESSDEEPDGFGEHDDFFDEPIDPNRDISFATFAKQHNEDGFDEPEDEEVIPELEENSVQPSIGILAETDNVFSYFDNKFMKNWAGPEHWKMKPVQKKKEIKEGGNSVNNEKRPRAEKTTCEIDFINQDDQFDVKALFSSDGKKNLSRRIADKSTDLYLLPEDLHFSSRNFLKLFTKPAFALRPKKRVKTGIEGGAVYEVEPDNGSLPGDYGNDFEVDTPGFQSDAHTEDENNTQFGSQLEVTDSYFDMNTNDLEKEINSNFGEQMMPELKHIQNVKISFVKVAKRVDVKLLKENIWDVIERNELPKKYMEGIGESDPMTSQEPSDKIEFSSLVKEIPKAYSKKKAKDLSVPFCFICLLHLANEHNLEIEDDSNMNELYIKKEEESILDY